MGFEPTIHAPDCWKRNSEPPKFYHNINLDILPLGPEWLECVQLRREHRHYGVSVLHKSCQ